MKLTAIRDALDRGGVSAKTAVEVEVSAKPFERVFDAIESGRRSDFRRNLGTESDETNSTPLFSIFESCMRVIPKNRARPLGWSSNRARELNVG